MSGYLKENKDKNGKVISIRISVPVGKDDNGKARYHWETLKTDSKRVAEKRIRQIQSEHDKGSYIKPGKLTLAEYLQSWLNDYCEPNLAPDTTETYRIMCNAHIIPALGQKALTALKAQDIQHLESQKKLSGRCDGKGGLSNRSVKYIHSTLSKALKMAVKAGLLLHNPIEGVEPPKVKRHEFNTLSEDDINNVLYKIKDSEYYPLYFTDMFSGMRRSEILALSWKDIDLFEMTASVNRTIKVLRGGEVKFRPTKTVKSRRLIDLTPANCSVLREHRAKQEKIRKSLNLPPISDNDFVFSHFDGRPYLPDTITHVWMMIAKRNGLAGIRLHDIRHSHATILFKQGVHPKIVQERLGHATISTTLDICSHVVPGLQAAAAAGFDSILRPKENKLEIELKELIQK